ncbi:MAG: DUF971 domain-containing protein [Planctomycetaceae bacterium]
MMTDQPLPTAIRRVPTSAEAETIEIEWSDGVRARYTPRLLRDACPCATCREKRAVPAPAGGLTVLRPDELVPLAVSGMRPVGQYAYSIAFTDGHDTGIYTLDYLRELAGPA